MRGGTSHRGDLRGGRRNWNCGGWGAACRRIVNKRVARRNEPLICGGTARRLRVEEDAAGTEAVKRRTGRRCGRMHPLHGAAASKLPRRVERQAAASAPHLNFGHFHRRCWCGHRAFSRASGAVTVLRIAIGWMMCQGRHPAPPPPSCLSEKIRMPSPRRQRAVYQGLRAPCRSPPVRLRPSRSRASSLARPAMDSDVHERCAATAGRGPDGDRGSTGPW
jgi:hypothetical protein